MNAAVRVGLVDDHRVLRDGLRVIIEESDRPLKVTLEASTGREALRELSSNPVDVLIVDISMPGMDGIELARRLRDEGAGIRTIVLTMYADADLVARAIKSGVWGYLLKDNAASTVVKAIGEVSVGRRFFDPSIPRSMIVELRRASHHREGDETELTARQIEVLRLICEGKTEREIATELGISYHTAHAHKNNIMRKLHIHSKVELVRYALNRHLVQS